MPDRGPEKRIVLGLLALAVAVFYGARYLLDHTVELNLHDPNAVRVATFELQSGEVGVVLRVRNGDGLVASATVWALRERHEEDADPVTYRKGETDSAGLVRVPVWKGDFGQTTLFARDPEGRVG